MSSSQLAVGAGEPALAEATVEVVRPGEPVRISNVLDVVLPAVKADDPASTFPGILGPATDAGTGRTNRLQGVAVVNSCDWLTPGYVIPEEFPDSLVDMSGPGADRSPFGATANVVLRFVPADGAPMAEVDAAIRRETARVARELAATTLGQEPDDVARYAWPLPAASDGSAGDRADPAGGLGGAARRHVLPGGGDGRPRPHGVRPSLDLSTAP